MQNAILTASLDWMAARFDAAAKLLRHPQNPGVHRVRESLWYAAGLLAAARSAAERRTALAIVDIVLDAQYDEPGAPWDGTFPRALEDPHPRSGAVVWRDYDPNWRQFIGCVFALLRRDYAGVLGRARCDRLRVAIEHALRGEAPGRIEPSYSNIALLHAWLSCEHGDPRRGETLAQAIETSFDTNHGFAEYNSPTYYGVDLWALALWRGSASAVLASAGARLEAALWRDIAAFYHPGLKNLCGPYDRTYGMDMTRYASLLGLWLWWGSGAPAFPDPRRDFAHAHDFCATPLLALAPPHIPDDVIAALAAPVEPRSLRRAAVHRTITASLFPDLMLGAVAPAPFDATGQARPVTAHWRCADGSIAWLSIHGGPLSARVSGATVELESDVELVLQSHAPVSVERRVWHSGGRRIEVDGMSHGIGGAVRVRSSTGRLHFA